MLSVGSSGVLVPQGVQTFDANGNPVTTVNEDYNFGWEYVWHCHILSHEEMDMMRPIQFNVARSTTGLLGKATPPDGYGLPKSTTAQAQYGAKVMK